MSEKSMRDPEQYTLHEWTEEEQKIITEEYDILENVRYNGIIDLDETSENLEILEIREDEIIDD